MTAVTSHAPRRIAVSTVLALLGSLLLSLPGALLHPAAAADVTEGLLLRYDLTQTGGTSVTDTSGNGNDGTLMNGGTWSGSQGLTLDGVNDYVKVPNNIMAGLSAITVSVDVYIESSQATPHSLWRWFRRSPGCVAQPGIGGVAGRPGRSGRSGARRDSLVAEVPGGGRGCVTMVPWPPPVPSRSSPTGPRTSTPTT